MNSAVGSFLMKVLLKKEVCGSREQCMEPVDSVHAREMLFSNKKKRGSETQMRASALSKRRFSLHVIIKPPLFFLMGNMKISFI